MSGQVNLQTPAKSTDNRLICMPSVGVSLTQPTYLWAMTLCQRTRLKFKRWSSRGHRQVIANNQHYSGHRGAFCDLAGSCMIDQALVCQCRQGGRDETERRFGRGECTCCTNCIRVTSTQRVRIGGPARNGFVTSGILGPSIIAAEHGMSCTHRKK
jgi:hypothetical protein